MADEKKPFHNPFAALGALRGTAPQAPAEPAAPRSSDLQVSKTPGLRVSKTSGLQDSKPPGLHVSNTSGHPSSSPSSVPTIPRAVVRLERSGRGGKEVTVIEHLAVSDRELWLKALKSSLGCGGTVEDERLVLQGDQRERVRVLLSARGVKKITVA